MLTPPDRIGAMPDAGNIHVRIVDGRRQPLPPRTEVLVRLLNGAAPVAIHPVATEPVVSTRRSLYRVGRLEQRCHINVVSDCEFIRALFRQERFRRIRGVGSASQRSLRMVPEGSFITRILRGGLLAKPWAQDYSRGRAAHQKGSKVPVWYPF